MINHQVQQPRSWKHEPLATAPVYQPVLSSAARGWYGIEALCYNLTPAHQPLSITDKWDRLVLYLDGSAMLARQFDGKWAHAMTKPGGLNLTPRNSVTIFEWNVPVTNLRLRLTPPLLAQLTDDLGYGDSVHIEMIERFNFRDPFIEQIGRGLLSEMQSGGLAGRLYAESMGQTLGMHLLKNYASVSKHGLSSPRYLNAQQMRRIADYVAERIDQDITLGELAGCVGLSPSYFTRLFKEATGVAPYQYLIARRVERARELLTLFRMTVAEAARLVGFYDQSHLIRHFKRIYGIAPASLVRFAPNVQLNDRNVQSNAELF
jgi:AraC family transcriptional regulator